MSNNGFVKLSTKELRAKYDKPIDRIKHMSNGQIVIRVIAMFLALAITSAGLYVVLRGVPLMGVPSKTQIVRAEIFSPRLTTEAVVIEDEENIEYARNIVTYLNKSLFREIEGEAGEPIVTIKFTDKNGNEFVVAGNESVGFYNGEVYPLARLNVFVGVAEGLFFPDLVDWEALQGLMQ